jgi:hypothetical protein
MNGEFMWRSFIVVFGILLVTPIHAAKFSGSYQGLMSNVPMKMVLTQKGASLTGTMSGDNGDHYQISATIKGDVATGSMLYTKDKSSWDFILNLREDGLLWTLTILGIPVNTAATLFEPALATKNRNTASVPQRVTAANLDERVIGSWRKTNAYVSGNFSVVSEKYMQLFADGKFLFGNGRVVGGSNSGSFDSGGNTNTTRGNWKTQNTNLYYMASGTSKWEVYGHYVFVQEGSTMAIVFENGNKEFWERSQ